MRERAAASEAGALIRELRRRRGLSQRALALRAGTKQATISRLEAGVESPTVERLERLLSVMGVRLELQPLPLREVDRADVTVARALTHEERLRESIAWNLFATELEIAVPRGRKK